MEWFFDVQFEKERMLLQPIFYYLLKMFLNCSKNQFIEGDMESLFDLYNLEIEFFLSIRACIIFLYDDRAEHIFVNEIGAASELRRRFSSRKN